MTMVRPLPIYDFSFDKGGVSSGLAPEHRKAVYVEVIVGSSVHDLKRNRARLDSNGHAEISKSSFVSSSFCDRTVLDSPNYALI